MAIIVQVYINRRQWEVMERQFIHAERAYVGIHSIEQHPHNRNAVLKIQNIGKLPADRVKVTMNMIFLAPPGVADGHGDPLKEVSATDFFYIDYLRTKLFRGNLHFEIVVLIKYYFSELEFEQVAAGNARLVIQVRIDYRDGLNNPDRSDYAFRFEGGKWIPWPVWTCDDRDSRVREEQSRYPVVQGSN